MDYVTYNAERAGMPAKQLRRSMAEAIKRANARHIVPTVKQMRSEWAANRVGFRFA